MKKVKVDLPEILDCANPAPAITIEIDVIGDEAGYAVETISLTKDSDLLTATDLRLIANKLDELANPPQLDLPLWPLK